MHKWRYVIRGFKESKDKEKGWAVGIRMGYWPCMKAYYFQVAFGVRRISVWYGGPEEGDS